MSSENPENQDEISVWIPSKRSVVLFLLALLIGLIAVAPQLIALSRMRNRILQDIVGDPNLDVTCSRASFGWTTPLLLENVKLRTMDGSVQIFVGKLSTEQSWLTLLKSAPDIGAIEAQRLRVEWIVDPAIGDDEPPDDYSVTSLPVFSLKVTDGKLLVREKGVTKPVIDAEQINLRVHTEQTEGGSKLTVEPIQLADRIPLSREMCDRGLDMIAPELSDEVEVQGECSVELTAMQFVVNSKDEQPIQLSEKESKIEGVVTLHQVTAALKNEMTRRLAQFTAELLDLGDVPEQIRLVENTKLTFRWSDDRIEHEGMAYAIPELAPGLSIRSEGSVAVDESLDLKVEFQIPIELLNDTPLARKLVQSPLKLRIAGTVYSPEIRLPPQLWVSHLNERLAIADLTPEEQELADRITEVFEGTFVESSQPAGAKE